MHCWESVKKPTTAEVLSSPFPPFRAITPIPVVPGLLEKGPYSPKYLDGKKTHFPTPRLTPTSCSGGPQALTHLPDPQELGLLPRGTGLCLHLEAVDVGDGDDRGSHVPGLP